ncbi:DUF2982 domain-containing protein [Vibrio gallaecicus]|uniref:DUF2982 domain-containing protein n=1 Tax=Vibrio TaxID=662 RepID=UPI0010C96A81|nr:DUF2982 domain-containing protein [Vibrio gallaecicus]MDN3613740.1 DUF2982 domain-containing protein [Vibrio gallaecicus]
MNTRHLSNFTLPSWHYFIKPIGYFFALFFIFFLIYNEYRKPMLVTILTLTSILFSIYYFALRSHVMITLTSTHLQQHFFKGGWVVKWDNVQEVSICTFQQDGWHEPLPWIGIKLKHYKPYLDSICPKVACELLLSQRGLLYLGAKQAGSEAKFEDIVLDSNNYIDKSPAHTAYTGMLAMLANRMKHQRSYHGFDIFIATNEINMSGEEFVGLARRYLAAAELTNTNEMN